jgi:dihydroflavonol-4-reductase
VGERYILGGENLTLAQVLALVAAEVGRKPPAIRLPTGVLWPVAVASETLARVAGIEPLVTRDTLKMARKKMWFTSAKAQAALGYAPRPARQAIVDAVSWLREQGRLAA